MVFGNFNAHHPSWFSRTKDGRAAARGEAFNGAINSTQLANASQNLTTRFPSLGQPSSPDITLLRGHLLPDVTWSTHTTLGFDHIPITVSLSIHAPPSPRKACFNTNFHKADWEGFTAESERRFAETPLPTSCSAGKKSSGVSSAGITAALSPMLCDPLSRREISAALMTPSTLPLSCRTETSRGSFARKRKTTGGPSWSPPTAPPIPSATLLVSSAQARQQEVQSPTKHLNRLWGKNPLQLEGDCTSLQQAVHCLFRPTRSGEKNWINFVRHKSIFKKVNYFLTLYGANSFFRRFSGHNPRYARFVYQLISATLIGNFLDDPFLK